MFENYVYFLTKALDKILAVNGDFELSDKIRSVIFFFIFSMQRLV